MTQSTDRQKRARKGKACIFTSLKNYCDRAELVEVEGTELRLCKFHEHNLRRIVTDAKAKADRYKHVHAVAA